MDTELEVTNIVASGELDLELDLESVSNRLQDESEWISETQHHQVSGDRLLMEFQEGDSLGFLTRNGVFFFTGSTSTEELEKSKEQMFTALHSIGVISSVEPPESEYTDELKLQNVVAVGDVDKQLNLNKLSVELGLENTEYEPEQFPGLIYRPEKTVPTFLIFSSGKVVVTGAKSEEGARSAFKLLKQNLS